jgi:hypothetical protein
MQCELNETMGKVFFESSLNKIGQLAANTNDPSQRSRLQNVLKAYGERGDPKVTIGFRNSTESSYFAETAPNGRRVTFFMLDYPLGNLLSANQFTEAVGHEGTHVSDKDRMRSNPSLPHLDRFQAEYRAFQTSSLIVKLLGMPSYGYISRSGAVLEIWNSTWLGLDRATVDQIRDQNITQVIRDYYGIGIRQVPAVHNPWGEP